jgi:hypothetical protein
VDALLDEMRNESGYIFNLGHGLLPSSRLENIQAIVETVRAAKNPRRGGTVRNQENAAQFASARN